MRHVIDLNLDRLQSFSREIRGWFQRVDARTPIQRLPLSHMERRLKALQAAVGKPKRTLSRKHLWHGVILIVLSVLLAGVGFAGIFTRLKYVPYDVIYAVGLVFTWAGCILFGIVGVFLAAYLFRVAQRLLYPGGEELLKTDKRQPIVFLRSFDDDYMQFVEEKFDWASFLRKDRDKSEFKELVRPFKQFLSRILLTKREIEVKEPGVRIEKMRFERVIHRQLRKLGPVIGIGRPGEKLPNFAVSRERFAEDEWKEAMLGWLERARMIVVVAGYSEGIKWEIEQIALKGFTSKVLVLLPPRPNRLITSFGQLWENWKARNADHRRERWAIICEKFVPEESRRALRRVNIDQLIAFHLAADGQPVLIRSKKHTPSAYELALRVAAYSMHCHQGKATSV